MCFLVCHCKTPPPHLIAHCKLLRGQVVSLKRSSSPWFAKHPGQLLIPPSKAQLSLSLRVGRARWKLPLELHFNIGWLPNCHSVCVLFLVCFVMLPFCGQWGQGLSVHLDFRIAVGLRAFLFCFVSLVMQEGRDISVSGSVSVSDKAE